MQINNGLGKLIPLIATCFLLGCNAGGNNFNKSDSTPNSSPKNVQNQIKFTALRKPGQNFKDAAYQQLHLNSSGIVNNSAIKLKSAISNLDFSKVNTVNNYNELLSIFEEIRDTRFMNPTASHMPAGFIRRISWMNPYDGCWARAAAGNYLAKSHNLPLPSKIFAFGNLKAESPYSRTGPISWWFHVALVLGVANQNKFYVIDPGLETSRPLTIDEWYSKMGDKDQIEGVVCNPYTYKPSDSCDTPSAMNNTLGVEEENDHFLDGEYENITLLGYDADKVLGDSPPWLK